MAELPPHATELRWRRRRRQSGDGAAAARAVLFLLERY